ncbi:MAG: hypothetical protein IKQ04_07750 [Oscillospiraceae bacterium]|nr:hypothetical protein [Oscillospiraceae bacterium]
MVKLIAGLSGTGKTQRMVNEINEAVEREGGSLVCIEQKTSLRFDLNYKVRLIEYQAYQLEGVESLKAFISGLHAGNFDITHVYLKSVHRLLGTDEPAVLAAFCDWCQAFGGENGIHFTMTARLDPAAAPEALRTYLA